MRRGERGSSAWWGALQRATPQRLTQPVAQSSAVPLVPTPIALPVAGPTLLYSPPLEPTSSPSMSMRRSNSWLKAFLRRERSSVEVVDAGCVLVQHLAKDVGWEVAHPFGDEISRHER